MENVKISSKSSYPAKATFVFYLNNVNMLRLNDVYFENMNYTEGRTENSTLKPIHTIFDISKIMK
jgi:hypothetical protein